MSNNLSSGFISLIIRNLFRSFCAFHLENGLWPSPSVKIPKISKKFPSIINEINPELRFSTKWQAPAAGVLRE